MEAAAPWRDTHARACSQATRGCQSAIRGAQPPLGPSCARIPSKCSSPARPALSTNRRSRISSSKRRRAPRRRPGSPLPARGPDCGGAHRAPTRASARSGRRAHRPGPRRRTPPGSCGAAFLPRMRSTIACFTFPGSSRPCARQISWSSSRISSSSTRSNDARLLCATASTSSALFALVRTSSSKPVDTSSRRARLSVASDDRLLGRAISGRGREDGWGVGRARGPCRRPRLESRALAAVVASIS